MSYITPHLCMPHKFWLDGRQRILCCLFIGCVSLTCCQSWFWPVLIDLVPSQDVPVSWRRSTETSIQGEISCPARLQNLTWCVRLTPPWTRALPLELESQLSPGSCPASSLLFFILLTAHCWVFFFHVHVSDQTLGTSVHRSKVVSLNFPLLWTENVSHSFIPNITICLPNFWRLISWLCYSLPFNLKTPLKCTMVWIHGTPFLFSFLTDLYHFQTL